MSEKKVFISADNKATFVCPICQNTKISDVSKYKNIQKAVRVKISCPCGHSYSVLLERRKFYRKETNLPGVYIYGKNIRSAMTVKDLSRDGVKFEQKFKSNLKVGDVVIVEFKLDNSQGTMISREVVIRTISGLNVGAEFCSQNLTDEATRALNFYLFN